MTLKLMFKLIINESLSHQLANSDLNLCLLLEEPVILTYLNLIILN